MDKSREFRTLSPGEPFLFKLHYPDNAIAGGGFFTHSSRLPASVAWDAFGEKNGAASYEETVWPLGSCADRVRIRPGPRAAINANGTKIRPRSRGEANAA